MKKYIYLVNILLMSVILGFSACSDDDDDNGQGNAGTTGGETIALNNQFSSQDQIKDILSVLRFDQGYNAVFYLSPTANIQDVAGMNQANDYLKVSMPTGRLGLNTDFSQTGMKVEYSNLTLKSGRGASGPMRIDIDGDNIKIEMQVEAGEGIECRYEGKFLHQISENLANVTPMGDEKTTATLVSAFRTKAKGEKRTVTFAVGMAEADSPNGLSAAKYTMMFMAPMKHFDGKYHTFKKADGYQFYLIDNENKKYANEVTEGRMRITGKATDEKMHLVFEATLSDGSTVTGDYYGTLQNVEDMDILPAKNAYTYLSSSGENENKKIIEVIYRYEEIHQDQEVKKKQHRFGFKYDEWQEFGGYPSLLEVIIDVEALGVVNGDLTDTPGWKVNYGRFQTQYIAPEDPNGQYMTKSKGTITAIKVGENYRFNIAVETIPAKTGQKAASMELSYEGPVTVVE